MVIDGAKGGGKPDGQKLFEVCPHARPARSLTFVTILDPAKAAMVFENHRRNSGKPRDLTWTPAKLAHRRGARTLLVAMTSCRDRWN